MWPFTRGSWVAPVEPESMLLEHQRVALEFCMVEAARGAGEPDAAHNNRGEAVLRYRAGDGTGGAIDTGAPWCASLQSYCDVAAAAQLRRRCPVRLSRGAKTLTERYAAVGRWVIAPGQDARGYYPVIPPGSLICWHRGPQGARTGHVGRVASYVPEGDELVVVDGNRNNRGPAGARYSVVEARILRGAQWRAGLYGVASLA